MNDLKTFLETLGGLHDAVLQTITWNLASRALELTFKDIYIDLEGFPDYPGPTPGTVILREVENISFELESKEKRLHIYEFVVERSDDGRQIAAISFWPSDKINATFSEARINGVSFDELSNLSNR